MVGIRNIHAIRILGLVILLSAAMLIAKPGGLAQQSGASDSAAATEKAAEKLPGLAELVHKSTKLDEQFSELQRRFPKIYDGAKIEEKFASLTERLTNLKEKTEKLQASDKLNYQDLAALKSAFQQKSDDCDDMAKVVFASH